MFRISPCCYNSSETNTTPVTSDQQVDISSYPSSHTWAAASTQHGSGQGGLVITGQSSLLLKMTNALSLDLHRFSKNFWLIFNWTLSQNWLCAIIPLSWMHIGPIMKGEENEKKLLHSWNYWVSPNLHLISFKISTKYGRILLESFGQRIHSWTLKLIIRDKDLLDHRIITTSLQTLRSELLLTMICCLAFACFYEGRQK